MKSPIFGGEYIGRSQNLVYERAVNLIPELVETRVGKAVGALYGTPGYTLFATCGEGPVYGSYTHLTTGTLYVVSGNGLYSIASSGVATLIGSIYGTTGPVTMIDNGANNQLAICNGVGLWVYNLKTAAFAQILPGQLGVTPTSIAFQDGVLVANDAGTNQWYQSDLGDFTSWQALNFSSADSTPDNVLSMFDLHREVWLFKQKVIEVWVNAGINGFLFQRLQGVQVPQGIAAPASVARMGDGLVWLGGDEQGAGVVYISQGYQALPISTHSISESIQSYNTYSDAIGWVEQEDQHFLYWLTFPSAPDGGQTFVWDSSTKLWHERAAFSNGSFSRHAANCHAFAYGQHFIGDYASGNVYALSKSVYTDSGAVHKWLRTWRALPPNQVSENPVTLNALQIDMQTGIGVPAGTNPQYMLRWSDDAGHTWSNEMWSGGNQPGQTASRIRFKRLGSTKRGAIYDRTFELSGVDPVPVAIIGATIDAS
jgi:hypothetical protein